VVVTDHPRQAAEELAGRFAWHLTGSTIRSVWSLYGSGSISGVLGRDLEQHHGRACCVETRVNPV